MDGSAGLAVNTRSSGPGRHVPTVLLRGGRLAAHGTWRMPRAIQVGLGLDWPPPRAAGHGTGAARAADYPPFGTRLGLDSPRRGPSSAQRTGRTPGADSYATAPATPPAGWAGHRVFTPTRAGLARRDEVKNLVTPARTRPAVSPPPSDSYGTGSGSDPRDILRNSANEM